MRRTFQLTEEAERDLYDAAHFIAEDNLAAAIKDGSSIKHEDGEARIDLFRIPQWFYDEVVAGRYPLQPRVS